MQKEHCCQWNPEEGEAVLWRGERAGAAVSSWTWAGVYVVSACLSCRQLTCWPPAEALRAQAGPIGRQAALLCVVSMRCLEFLRVNLDPGSGSDMCLMSPFKLWDSTTVSRWGTWGPSPLSGAGSHGALDAVCELPLNFPQWQETVGPLSLYFGCSPFGHCWPCCSGSMSRQ